MKVADGKIKLIPTKRRLLLNVETKRLRGPASLTPTQALRLAARLHRWAFGFRNARR